MKRSRPLALFFSVLIFLFLFSFTVLGASDNLISSDLTTWTDVSNLQEESVPISVTTGGNVYRVTLSEGNYTIYYGAILDHTSLVSGHSYSLSFKMPSTNEINAAFGRSYSDSSITNHFKNASLMIGVAFISPSGVLNMPDDYLFFDIGSSNYTNFFGKSLSASFVASNYSGTPVVVMILTSLDGNPHTFYFSDFKLVDNDDNSAELTGIKGFLHSIRWDLVGGVCDEDDCPHSSTGNPHLSLTDRMSTGFQSMFDNIGDSLTSLKESFTQKIGELNTSLSSLGDRMNGFFSNLGDRMSGFFSDLGDRISGFFGSLGDRISGFFGNLKTDLTNWFASVGDWFSTLGDRITTKFQEIGDKFSEFFDKFKPRVYMNFEWQKGYVLSSNGNIYASSYTACTSELFYVEPELNFQVEFAGTVYNRVEIAQYDADGNFIKLVTTIRNPEVIYNLEPGYCYRFSLISSNVVTSDMYEFCNDYCLVYSEEGWINALVYKFQIGIEKFFRGFGNLILYFNWDGEYTNPFEREDSPIDKVSEWFDNLIEYVDSIGTSIENVLDSITGGLHIFDEFTSRFPWLKGIAMFCLAILVLSRFIGL